jgi:hypothetical protein
MAGDRELLDDLQRRAFAYFLRHADPVTGLIADTSREGADASVAAVGMGLAAYAVGVERGFLSRDDAVLRTLRVLRFLLASPQGEQPDATCHRGFYYHFLDMHTGRRANRCELSPIDTAMLFAGMLVAAQFFDADTPDERELRAIADELYRRADWHWAQDGGKAVSHGWKPEMGFLNYGWDGYSEAILLYVLGLGSPTHPLPAESYPSWALTYQWESLYGFDHLFSGPLFVHLFSHAWIDFRGIQDEFMRERRSDYFENTRRAVLIQREYAIRNPHGFAGYGRNAWGITAGEGPGPAVISRGGVATRFYGYVERGVPYGPDDGTLAPWTAVAALPFAPDTALAALRHFRTAHPGLLGEYGIRGTFNPTLSWTSGSWFGIELGPIVMMIENHRSGFVWRLLRGCPYVVAGLRGAGFTNGWLA